MPRDKVALLINSCAKKPKPRRVTPSAPRPAQRSEHIDDALMATKRRRVAFGDVSIHVFPMAIADNPAVRSGVALGLGREEVCCIVKSVDEHQPQHSEARLASSRARPRPWTGSCRTTNYQEIYQQAFNEKACFKSDLLLTISESLLRINIFQCVAPLS